MEYLNKVELIGRVGAVKVTEVGDKKVIRLSVATNETFQNSKGEIVIETTWHNVTGWESEKVTTELEKLELVHIVGRIKNQKYTDAEGVERYSIDIIASEIEKVV